jgi:hypothetical protein
MKTVRSIGEDGERQSMISRRRGVRSVRHEPGSALARCESVLYLSAHCEIVKNGSGRAPAAAATE